MSKKLRGPIDLVDFAVARKVRNLKIICWLMFIVSIVTIIVLIIRPWDVKSEEVGQVVYEGNRIRIEMKGDHSVFKHFFHDLGVVVDSSLNDVDAYVDLSWEVHNIMEKGGWGP